jgi:hypothetical protein
MIALAKQAAKSVGYPTRREWRCEPAAPRSPRCEVAQ